MSDSNTGFPSWETPTQPAGGATPARNVSGEHIVQPRPAAEYLADAGLPPVTDADETMPPVYPPTTTPAHAVPAATAAEPAFAAESVLSVPEPEIPHLETSQPEEPVAAPVAQPVVAQPVVQPVVAQPVIVQPVVQSVAEPAAPATAEPAAPVQAPAQEPVQTQEPTPEPAPAAEPVAEPAAKEEAAQDAPAAQPAAVPATAGDDRYQKLAEEVDRNAKATAEELAGLRESLDGLSKQFSKRMQYDDAKETIIDRQHRELTQLREGLKANLIQPVLYDVAETLASVHKMRAKLAAEAHEADGLLEDIEFMLLNILEENDVEEVSSDPDTPFDATRQRMSKTEFEETEDDSKRKVVARSLAPGYMFGKYALLKESVVLYKVVPPQAGSAAPAPDAK